jgi:WXG100 family type VII secretion target
MPGSGYSYTPHSLQDVIDSVHQADVDMQNKLIDLQTMAQNSLSMWTDEAQHAYAQLKKQWDDAMTQANSILGEKTAPALTNMLDTMNGTEKKNMNLWY